MSFNEAQTEAIHHKEGPLLIIAGPGSGKTTVIVNRTKNLIEEHHIDPSKILVVTFTKSAAEEMGIRFQNYVWKKRIQINILAFILARSTLSVFRF